jgi:hypothetical protein
LINEDAPTQAEDGWFVSSFTSARASCVQVKFAEQGTILVRDSKDRSAASPIITMPSPSWASLLSDVSARS